MMNKKAFGLLLAIVLLLLLSGLSIFIIEYKRTAKQTIVYDTMYNQAQLHLNSTIQRISHIDLYNLSQPCINDLEFDETNFKIRVNFSYITKRLDCTRVVSTDFNDSETKGMALATVAVYSTVEGYEKIRLVKTVPLKL